MPRFRKIPAYRSAAELAAYADTLGWTLPHSDNHAALAGGFAFTDGSRGRVEVGNRFTALPMEGWDAGADGSLTANLKRRWLRIAGGGAKLLWFEATAVRPDGRANPRQLMLQEGQTGALAHLLAEARSQHAAEHGAAGVVAGLQLTHSGRWCRPEGPPAPVVAYRHPWLDARSGDGDPPVFSDAELEALVEDYVATAVRARDAGFDFVDIKHCHGYLLHELLSASGREGRFGGSLAGRTEFLRAVTEGVRARAPELALAVRLSAYDFMPFKAGSDGVGEPDGAAPYPHAFGGDGSGQGINVDVIVELLEVIHGLGIGLVCITAGSPYYNPHIQRPAFYPPSDGYQPPEDPLAGVCRLLATTGELKRRCPGLALAGTGFSYLQDHVPAVAAGCIETGWMDSVGLGRMLLSYPNLPADVLASRKLARKLICRTFSDCTTAPRNGLRSGCFPLDSHYRDGEEYGALQVIKRG